MKKTMKVLSYFIQLCIFYLGGVMAVLLIILLINHKPLDGDYVSTMKLKGLLYNTTIIIYMEKAHEN